MAHHCRVCDRWFKRTVDLDQHIRDSPYHREPYCAPCDRFFVDYNALQNHLDNSRFHTGWDDEEKETEEYYSSDDEAYCEKCNRSFVDEYSLGQHLERSDAHKPVLTKTPPNLHVAITPVAAQAFTNNKDGISSGPNQRPTQLGPHSVGYEAPSTFQLPPAKAAPVNIINANAPPNLVIGVRLPSASKLTPIPSITTKATGLAQSVHAPNVGAVFNDALPQEKATSKSSEISPVVEPYILGAYQELEQALDVMNTVATEPRPLSSEELFDDLAQKMESLHLSKFAASKANSRGLLLCWGNCGEKFATVADNLKHLEGNLCTSGIQRVEIHAMVAEQPFSREILFHPLLQELATGVDLERKYGIDVHPFVCPSAACPLSFRTLTELYQHAYEEDDNKGPKLVRASTSDCRASGGEILRRLADALSYRTSHGIL